MKSFTLRRAGLAISLAFTALTAALPAHADMEKIRSAGVLKVAVYNDFAPV